MTRKCFRQHKYPKRPHIGHNLFLATYFDIFLAIESKISPKMSIFLMLLAPIWEWSKLTFFKPKIIKSSYFEFQKSYIPQRKLKTYKIRIQLEKKNQNLWKKKFFFNFLDMLKDPKKFQFSVFQKFWKIYFKNGFTGTSQIVRETKSPILVILALLMRKLQTNVWCPGHIDPCPPEIGLSFALKNLEN